MDATEAKGFSEKIKNNFGISCFPHLDVLYLMVNVWAPIWTIMNYE
jgi:hypothetical protein